MNEEESWGFARGFPCQIATKSAAALISNATAEIKAEDDSEFLHLRYGDQEGDDYPREIISKFLTEEYGELVPKSSIFISGGASLSLYFLGQHVAPKGCKFLVEEVTYFLALKVIREDLRRDIIPVKCSPCGIDLTDLEKKLQVEYASCPADQPFSCVFYTIPTFHNPRNICYDEDTAISVVRLAKKYKALVICDDVYSLLYLDGEAIPRRMRSYALKEDAGEFVLSMGSFSKICAPGLRLSWIECSPVVFDVMKTSWTLTSGCNFGHYPSYLMSKAIVNGSLKKHIQILRKLYRERVDYLFDQLKAALPPGAKVSKPKGGYFFWVELPKNYVAARLWEISMKQYNLDFHSGEKFSAVGSHTNCLRLCYSFLPMPNLKLATSQFIASLEEYRKEIS